MISSRFLRPAHSCKLPSQSHKVVKLPRWLTYECVHGKEVDGTKDGCQSHIEEYNCAKVPGSSPAVGKAEQVCL